ncbi:MAG: hypothetical protein ACI8UR_000757 [Natronomonas sp.]|jgi:hypothetical protein|uniref:hypothetical protein n=1 Tax=Natronomonas sp. TaxID=2184060 RepID=UPI0039898068
MVESSLQLFLPFVAAALLLAGGVRRGIVSLLRHTVPAAAPWTLTAAVMVVGVRLGAYQALPAQPTAVELLGALTLLVVIVWLCTAELASLRGVQRRERYLSASGIGALFVISVSLLTSVGGASPLQLVWLALAPIGAVLFAAAGYFVLGLVYTDAVVEFQLTGVYVIGTIVLDGFASAVAVETLANGTPGVVTTVVIWAVSAVGGDISVWLLLPLHVFLGVVFLGACGWLARRESWVGNACALLASVLALGSATVVLLSSTLLG